MFDNGIGSFNITPSGKVGIGIGDGLTIIPESGKVGIGDDGITIDPTEGLNDSEERSKRLNEEMDDRRRERRRNNRWD